MMCVSSVNDTKMKDLSVNKVFLISRTHRRQARRAKCRTRNRHRTARRTSCNWSGCSPRINIRTPIILHSLDSNLMSWSSLITPPQLLGTPSHTLGKLCVIVRKGEFAPPGVGLARVRPGFADAKRLDLERVETTAPILA